MSNILTTVLNISVPFYYYYMCNRTTTAAADVSTSPVSYIFSMATTTVSSVTDNNGTSRTTFDTNTGSVFITSTIFTTSANTIFTTRTNTLLPTSTGTTFTTVNHNHLNIIIPTVLVITGTVIIGILVSITVAMSVMFLRKRRNRYNTIIILLLSVYMSLVINGNSM